ncbi:hypothetical protein JAAARDRAFT_33988 [Jaapia argillacea MUCL 33604]|uniref:Uncharacterized protein n=1 Tax=Jaapia argillacea MUCL 33604 TaxID=933084 RepID=A0A067Q9J5_9AGAM|nr:hypothetical protein JAAARDRAFT_33988 [Jaapia argillacea MUCL 33604]
MLLPRIRPGLVNPKPKHCLYLSNAATTPKYHRKVRAYPFALSKEEAILEMAQYGAMTTLSPGNWFQSFMAQNLPFFGHTPMLPERIQALYLPTWHIDAEVEAKIHLTSDSSEEVKTRLATVHLTNSYMPGFSFDPLTRFPFPALRKNDLPTDWTPDMAVQHGMNISCLPYTFSPLDLVDKVRDLAYSEAIVTHNFRFEPSSININLLAGYPVLVPIYIAKYRSKFLGREWTATVILDASDGEGRVVLQDPMEQVQAMGINLPSFIGHMNSLVNGDTKGWTELNTDSHHFGRVELLLAPLNQRHLVDEVNGWMDQMAYRSNAFDGLGNGQVDMDDLRVRPATGEEMLTNRKWMALGVEYVVTKDMLANLSRPNISDSKVISIGFGRSTPGTQQQDEASKDASGRTLGPIRINKMPVDDLTKAFKTKLEELEKQREEMKPKWLRDRLTLEGERGEES